MSKLSVAKKLINYLLLEKKTISKTSRITSFLLFTKLDNTKQRNVKR